MSSIVSSVRNRDDMHALLNERYTRTGTRPSLKCLTVLTKLDPRDLPSLVELHPSLSEEFSLDTKHVDDKLYKLQGRRKLHGRTIDIDALIDHRSLAWNVISMAKRPAIELGVTSLFKALYPEVINMFLNHFQILTILEKARERYGARRFMTFYAIRNEAFDESGEPFIERRTLDSPRAEKELREIAQERRIWLEWLRFKVTDASGLLLLDCVMTSHGLTRLIQGHFTYFYDNVLTSTVEIGTDWDHQYENVKRIIEDDDVRVRRCRIEYDRPFAIDQLRDLGETLTGSYLVSIVHLGNPFFSADVYDTRDGSSFGVTALGRRVTISPMLSSSSAALWRLAETVQYVLGEGRIVVEDSS